MGLKLDLGGGEKPRPGFLNVDGRDLPGVDYLSDFSKLAEAGSEGARLPFADDLVEEVVCSHTLEHVFPYRGFLHEIARVCRVGAMVEIRVPHWLHEGAMLNDHLHTVPPCQVDHWAKSAIPFWWKGSAKRFRLDRTEFIRGGDFAELKGLYWWFSDDQLLRLVPNACHEIAYFFTVIPHADSAGP